MEVRSLVARGRVVLLILGVVAIGYGFGVSLSAEYGYGPIETIAHEESGPQGSGQETVTIRDVNSKTYTFTGTRQQANDWEQEMVAKLQADLAVPALRSRLEAAALTLFLSGVVLGLIGLGILVMMLLRSRAERAGKRPSPSSTP